MKLGSAQGLFNKSRRRGKILKSHPRSLSEATASDEPNQCGGQFPANCRGTGNGRPYRLIGQIPDVNIWSTLDAALPSIREELASLTGCDSARSR
jgi:hypothetical protein